MNPGTWKNAVAWRGDFTHRACPGSLKWVHVVGVVAITAQDHQLEEKPWRRTQTPVTLAINWQGLFISWTLPLTQAALHHMLKPVPECILSTRKSTCRWLLCMGSYILLKVMQCYVFFLPLYPGLTGCMTTACLRLHQHTPATLHVVTMHGILYLLQSLQTHVTIFFSEASLIKFVNLSCSPTTSGRHLFSYCWKANKYCNKKLVVTNWGWQFSGWWLSIKSKTVSHPDVTGFVLAEVAIRGETEMLDTPSF